MEVAGPTKYHAPVILGYLVQYQIQTLQGHILQGHALNSNITGKYHYIAYVFLDLTTFIFFGFPLPLIGTGDKARH